MQYLALISTHTVDQVLAPHIYVFYAAFLVSIIFTPVMRAIAIHYGVIDRPDTLRKVHSAPVAYLGGFAVFLGWVVGLAVSQLHVMPLMEDSYVPYSHVKMSIVAGALVIVGLGLWDDIRRLRPVFKILGQLIAAGIMLLQHVGDECLAPLFTPLNDRLLILHWPLVPEWFIVATSCITALAVVVGCCNATNLMDGLDGLCGGVTAVIAAGFLFLAIHLGTAGLDPDWDAVRIVLALALLGGVLGFIPYNFNPASIFMGDTGSMFLGYAIANMILLLAQQQSKWFLAALVMFALPVLDTALAFARRYVNNRPVFSADRHHFHHQLVARGYSVRKTVLISYLLTILFVGMGAMIVFMRTRYAVAFYLVIFGFIIVAAYKMGLVHEKRQVVENMPLQPMDSAIIAPEQDSQAVLEMREKNA